MDARAIGTSLGVSHLVEGSVQGTGEQLRIHVQVTRTADGYQVWSDTLDTSAGGLFEARWDLGHKVSGALGAAAGAAVPPLEPRTTASKAAWDAFVRGVLPCG